MSSHAARDSYDSSQGMNRMPLSGDPSNKIGTAKQMATAHDHLWSELDILDDATNMASTIKHNKSFFSSSHSQALQDLHKAQVELAVASVTAEKSQNQAKYKELWEVNDVEHLRNNIFDQEYFETLSNHMNNVIVKLDKVAACMKEIDEKSREHHL